MLILIVGDNGIGKSDLLAEIARRGVETIDNFGDSVHYDRHEAEVAAIGNAPYVAVTHSPYMVDQVGFSDVWVLARTDVATWGARLNEHPDVEKWEPLMQAGEFWVSVGERWVLDTEVARTGDALVEAILADVLQSPP
jgi:hypothetical protein